MTFAAQSNDYVDPADNWLHANGSADEFDINVAITYETQYCPVCNKDTIMLTYRVPEYTCSGVTALNHGVRFSDGMNIDGTGSYNFNKNVYGLNPCDRNFYLDFGNTEYEPYNDSYHTTILKKGGYCQFCKGTYARATEKKESHSFTEKVDGQLGNNRFYVSEHCGDCEPYTSEYVTAKSVVSTYYGTEDSDAHTLTVSDLSDSGVETNIRYGTSATNCNNTSAPKYTKAGYYTVYYKITYSYSGESMTENGVSYVWVLADNSDKDNASEIPHVHDYRYIETVKPGCADLGFER